MSTLFNTDLMLQTATYWGLPTPDVYGGGTFPAPVEIACRWEEKTELIRDRDGREVVSMATVYPDRELDEDGWLFLGSSAAADPHEVEGAYQIKSFRKVPDIFNEHHEFKAML